MNIGGYSWYNAGMQTQEILAALSTLRAGATPGEYDLHRLIAQALEAAGIAYCHEYRLSPRRRIDFFIDGVGLEVKKGRPDARALRAQIARYLEAQELREVIVVTQRAVELPRSIGAKRVTCVSLSSLWGVAVG